MSLTTQGLAMYLKNDHVVDYNDHPMLPDLRQVEVHGSAGNTDDEIMEYVYSHCPCLKQVTYMDRDAGHATIRYFA